MRALTTTANLALAISLLALTLSTLRSGRMPAELRSWVFFSIGSFTLLVHAALDAFPSPDLMDVSGLFEAMTLAFFGIGLAFLYGADRERVRRLHGEAERDSGTGLYNRGAFRTLVSTRLAKPTPAGSSLAILDLDGFKRVNDEFGHPRGDQLLELVAAALRANLRSRDLAARYGGDEFIIYFEACNERDAERVVQRIRASVQSVSELAGTAVTMSAGIAGYPIRANDFDGLVRAADEVLIRVKREGKDRVGVAV
ncbi:MAG: GGDEF domain-containing protein [Chloroflexi bacterium]|nr:MAG: GGDEF domain-containing protein [Chloroflexota bacterium]